MCLELYSSSLLIDLSLPLVAGVSSAVPYPDCRIQHRCARPPRPGLTNRWGFRKTGEGLARQKEVAWTSFVTPMP